MASSPLHIDLQKEDGLTLHWDDGTQSFYSIEYLRAHSPSADHRQLQEEMAKNPLTVLPSGMADQSGPLVAIDAKLVGNYAINITFSDGHKTGIYTWQYLRCIDPGQATSDTD